MFSEKVLLITGGTGSFGNAVLNRFINTDISQIIIFSRDEKKQEDMRIRLRNPKIKFVLGDVRDFNSISQAMRDVDYVFHAAALKQVPSCEFYPMEALRTNVMGTNNVIEAAISNKVKRLVLLSTDKAVYPINTMGITKALAERLVLAKSRNIPSENLILCATRYGNVMASRSSVIPLFIEQIKSHQPLTITDPSMTRFLMSLDDSVELVVHAFRRAHQGDIFIQKAPACTVSDLATALIELFDSNSKIKIIGTRHGEKRYESLVSREEMAKAVDLGRYLRIPADNRDLNYDKFISHGEIKANQAQDYTSENAVRLDIKGIKELLINLDYVRKAMGLGLCE